MLFSGSTVLISVAGLLLVRTPVFRTMAIGVMVAVALMLAITVTLLPAVLALLGERINRLAVPGGCGVRPGGNSGSLWRRWTDLVMRRPVLIGGAATLVLLLAAATPIQVVATQRPPPRRPGTGPVSSAWPTG